MSDRFDPSEADVRWQKVWNEKQTFRADDELWVSDEVDDEADAAVEAVTAQ